MLTPSMFAIKKAGLLCARRSQQPCLTYLRWADSLARCACSTPSLDVVPCSRPSIITTLGCRAALQQIRRSPESRQIFYLQIVDLLALPPAGPGHCIVINSMYALIKKMFIDEERVRKN